LCSTCVIDNPVGGYVNPFDPIIREDLVKIYSFSQWKGIWGFGATLANYKCKGLTIDNQLVGGQIFFEFPNFGEGISPRLEFNHLRRIGDTLVNSKNISRYSNLKLLCGYTILSKKAISVSNLFRI
jgi:hypothetical protein